jgi:hypothetical protein
MVPELAIRDDGEDSLKQCQDFGRKIAEKITQEVGGDGIWNEGLKIS